MMLAHYLRYLRDYSLPTGKLYMYVGSMYGGKTSKLLAAYKDVNEGCMHSKACLIKPSIDERYDKEAVCTHDGESVKVTRLIPYNHLESFVPMVLGIKKDYPQMHSLFIDEGNLFEGRLDTVVMYLLTQGLNVHIAGLLHDFNRVPFDSICCMLSYADNVMEFYRTCHVEGCTEQGLWTQRYINGELAPKDSPRILVGSDCEEMSCTYKVRCSTHFIQPE